ESPGSSKPLSTPRPHQDHRLARGSYALVCLCLQQVSFLSLHALPSPGGSARTLHIHDDTRWIARTRPKSLTSPSCQPSCICPLSPAQVIVSLSLLASRIPPEFSRFSGVRLFRQDFFREATNRFHQDFS